MRAVIQSGGLAIVGYGAASRSSAAPRSNASKTEDIVVPNSAIGIYDGEPNPEDGKIGPRSFEDTIHAVEDRLREALRVSIPTMPKDTYSRVLNASAGHIPGSPPFGTGWAEDAMSSGIYFTLPRSVFALESTNKDDSHRTREFAHGLATELVALNEMMGRYVSNNKATAEQVAALAQEILAVRGNFFKGDDIDEEVLFQAPGKKSFGFLMHVMQMGGGNLKRLFNRGIDDGRAESARYLGVSAGAAARELLQEAAKGLGLEQFPDEKEMVADAQIGLLRVLRDTSLDRQSWDEQERASFDAYFDRIQADLDTNLSGLRARLDIDTTPSVPVELRPGGM